MIMRWKYKQRLIIQIKILKKVGEECTEVIIAGKANDKAETVYEIADLVYHVMVLMIEAGISLEDIHREVGKIEGVEKVNITLTFEPQWDKSMMTEEAMLVLNLF